MHRRSVIAALPAVAAGLAAPGLAPRAHAQSFAGRRITIIVPSGEGGSTDVYARAMARALSQTIPGSPDILIRNIPGAGTMAGANQFQQRARPDGLTMLAVTTSTYVNYVSRNPAATYRMATFVPLVINPAGVVVFTNPALTGGRSGLEAIQALRDHGPVVFGGHSPTSAELFHLFAFHSLGIRIRPVWGLMSGQSMMAFMRGETQLQQGGAPVYLSTIRPMIERNEAVGLYSLGILEGGRFVRDPVAPELPTFTEAYAAHHGRELSGVERGVFESLYGPLVLANKGLLLPEGTPADILGVLTEAVERAIATPEIRAQLATELGDYPVYVREDAARAHGLASNMTDEAREWLAVFLRDNYNARL